MVMVHQSFAVARLFILPLSLHSPYYSSVDKIKQTTPHFYTVGRMQPLNKLSDLVRGELAQAGYMEILSLGLCSRLENFDHLRRKDDGSAVSVTNPATIEFQVCYIAYVCMTMSLMMMMMMLCRLHARRCCRACWRQCITTNRRQNRCVCSKCRMWCCWAMRRTSAPKTRNTDTLFRCWTHSNSPSRRYRRRRVCALYCTGQGSGFEQLHGLLDRLMQVLDVLPTDEKKARQAAYKAAKKRVSCQMLNSLVTRLCILTRCVVCRERKWRRSPMPRMHCSTLTTRLICLKVGSCFVLLTLSC